MLYNELIVKNNIKQFFINFGYDIKQVEKKHISDFFPNETLSDEIINNIFNFYKKITPFYDEDIPNPLKIAGMWKGILKNTHSQQIKYIQDNDKKSFKKLQEQMFYNELVINLITYSDYKSRSKNCDPRFLEECKMFEKITNKTIDDLVTNKVWACWGMLTKKGVVKYVDPSHGISAFHTLTLLEHIKEKKNHLILDLGSGFGGFAEKVMSWSKNSVNMCLVDIPLNLTTAYAYLSHIFGSERVTIISSNEELDRINVKDNTGNFFLIPTILVPRLSSHFQFDIVHNMHSFSEMDLHTVKYYLENLITKDVSFFIETNANLVDNIVFDHCEIRVADFPIPDTHKLFIRFSDGVYTRYVTSIYINKEK